MGLNRTAPAALAASLVAAALLALPAAAYTVGDVLLTAAKRCPIGTAAANGATLRANTVHSDEYNRDFDTAAIRALLGDRHGGTPGPMGDSRLPDLRQAAPAGTRYCIVVTAGYPDR